MYKTKSIKFCDAKFSRDIRHAETFKTRDSSRFKRLSMIRSISNDSDINETVCMESVADKHVNENATKKLSHLEKLKKWREDRELKRQLEIEKKKKPFYPGGNAILLRKPDSFKNSQNLKSFSINKSTYGGNTSRLQRSRIAAPAPVIPSKIPNVSKQKTIQQFRKPAVSKQASSNSNVAQQPPALKNIKMASSSSSISQPSATLRNTKSASSSSSISQPSATLRNTKPVFSVSKPVFYKPPAKPSIKINAGAPKLPSALPRIQTAVSTRPQQPAMQIKKSIPVKKEANLPKPTSKTMNDKKAANIKTSKENNLKVQKGKVENSDISTAENLSVPDLKLDVSAIKQDSSFAPSGFKFAPPPGISSIFDDDDTFNGITEVLAKFMSRTSTPTKSLQRASSFCLKNADEQSEIVATVKNPEMQDDVKVLGSHLDKVPPDVPPVPSNNETHELQHDLAKDEASLKDNAVNEELSESLNIRLVSMKSLNNEPCADKVDHDFVDVESVHECTKIIPVSETCKSVVEEPLICFAESFSNKMPNQLLYQATVTPGESLNNLLEKLDHDFVNDKASDVCRENCPVNNSSCEPDMSLKNIPKKDYESANDKSLDVCTESDPVNKTLCDSELKEATLNLCGELLENCDGKNYDEVNENITSGLDSFDVEEIKNVLDEFMTLDEEKLELVDIPEDDEVVKCIEKKPAGVILKRVSVLKSRSTLNSIAEADEHSPEKSLCNSATYKMKSEDLPSSAQHSKQVINDGNAVIQEDDLSPTLSTPRRSHRLQKRILPSAQAMNSPNLASFKPIHETHHPNSRNVTTKQNATIQKDDLSPVLSTPRRSQRLQKRIVPNAQTITSPNVSPFKPTYRTHYPNYTPRHSMKLRQRSSNQSDLLSFSIADDSETGISGSSETDITADLLKLDLNNADENVDPNCLIDFENSPNPIQKVKPKKVSLLYTPEKRKSIRKSIRGDLMCFSPSSN